MARDENKAAAEKAAEMLMGAHTSGAAFVPFAAAFGVANVAEAYAAQREFVRLQIKARGARSAGYKIGLTSKRMQEMCGIDSPIAGVVLADRVHASGATLNAPSYGRLGLEFEIAVRLKRDLVPQSAPWSRSPPPSRRSVRRSKSSMIGAPTIAPWMYCR
jgi:2-keto-4-pentenoate hydratase